MLKREERGIEADAGVDVVETNGRTCAAVEIDQGHGDRRRNSIDRSEGVGLVDPAEGAADVEFTAHESEVVATDPDDLLDGRVPVVIGDRDDPGGGTAP